MKCRAGQRLPQGLDLLLKAKADSPCCRPVSRTWAAKGQPPVLRHRFSWPRPVSGALAYRPDARHAALRIQFKEGSIQHRLSFAVGRVSRI